MFLFRNVLLGGLVLLVALELAAAPRKSLNERIEAMQSQQVKRKAWRGIHCYEEPEIMEQQTGIKRKSSKSSQSVAPTTTNAKKLAAWQGQIKEAKAKAILSPTHENVKEFQVLHRQVTDKSLAFAKAWQEVALRSGILDYAEANGTPGFREVQAAQKDMALRDNLAKLKGQGFGLFFFTRGSCPYCHKFAPVLKKFAEDFDLSVLEITEGVATGLFPAKQDNGIGAKLNKQGIYPMVYLVDLKRRQFHPLARGMVTPFKLKANASMVIGVLINKGVIR